MLILVVEDDARVASFLSRGLAEEGYTVDVCSDGEQARRQVQAQPYALVLLDWSLPGLDGVSLLRAWRGAGVTTPVIMVTARRGVDAAILALDSGADDYVEKPFSFDELLARIRANIRRGDAQGSGAPQEVRLGGAVVDLRLREVTRDDGEREALSQREFELLDALLKDRGAVVSRGRLLDRVWGMSHDPTTNVVDVYIRYLRRKLEGDAVPVQDSIIETVRGRGYRLRSEVR